MDFQFRTISLESSGTYKEKGSKFQSFAFPVERIQEIQEHLQRLRKLHHKARHHCFAYILGKESPEIRSSDDGEPKHSAGDPILGQIRSYELTNILIVVVRYFGGTKLGIGGLINAYREAARLAIENSTIVVRENSQTVVLTFAYPDMNEIMRLVKELKLTILEQSLEEECKMTLQVPISKLEKVSLHLKQIKGVKLLIRN